MNAKTTRKKATKARVGVRARSEDRPRRSAKTESLVGQLGWMRLTLIIVAVISIATTPEAGTLPVYSSWQMVPTLIVPVLTPLIFLLLLMDALMSRIWMTDKDAEARRHYKLAITLNLLLAVGIAIAWYPYFRAIAKQ